MENIESSQNDFVLIDTTFEQRRLHKIIEYYSSRNIDVITDTTQIIINKTKVCRFRVFTRKSNIDYIQQLKDFSASEQYTQQ